MTPNAQQQVLQRLYGQKIYLCHHPACENSSVPTVFVSIPERQAHEDKHSRPFVCNQQACSHSYGVIGFTTKKDLDRHHRKYHTSSDDTQVNLDAVNEISANQYVYTRHLGETEHG